MTKRAWTAVAVIAAVAALMGSVGGAYASHQFSDVGDGNFFHDNIDAIKEAGCASGFNDGTFQPNTAVNRGQFTLWFQNCLPRIASSRSTNPTSFPGGGNTPTVLATDTITVGGFPGERQFLRITGVADVRPSNDTFSCPGTGSAISCDTNLTINVGGMGDVATSTMRSAPTDTVQTLSYRRNLTVETVIAVTTGDTISYSLRGSSNLGTGGATAEERSLVGQTIPFGGQGTDAGP